MEENAPIIDKLSEKIFSDLKSKVITNILLYFLGSAIIIASYFQGIWLLIPLMERFVFIPWILLFYTYYICLKIEEVHGISKTQKTLVKRNYKGTLYWGILPAIVHYLPIIKSITPEYKEEWYYYAVAAIDWSTSMNNYFFGTVESRGRIHSIFQIAGLVIALCGSLLATKARIHLNGFWAIDILDYGDSNKIIRTGPYEKARHPIYAGQIMLVTGTAIVFEDFLMFLFCIIVFLMNRKRAIVEEQEFKEKSNEYGEYLKNTEFMIPGIY
jgi:protein-S-isoprenylcysteine O-methyltransferase Ste14